MARNSRKAVEDDLEVVHREEQQKMNELDVVVPLRLNQVSSRSYGGPTLSEHTLTDFGLFTFPPRLLRPAATVISSLLLHLLSARLRSSLTTHCRPT